MRREEKRKKPGGEERGGGGGLWSGGETKGEGRGVGAKAASSGAGPETAQLCQFTSVEEDAEEVIKPSSTVYVEGWSHVRVGVRFSPTKTTLGERDMSIELENSNVTSYVVSL